MTDATLSLLILGGADRSGGGRGDRYLRATVLMLVAVAGAASLLTPIATPGEHDRDGPRQVAD